MERNHESKFRISKPKAATNVGPQKQRNTRSDHRPQTSVTRQTVHQTLDIANLKLTDALEETAKINKIETQKLDPDKGYLLGYSSHFRTPAFITFSAKNGVQVWYKHEGDCAKCKQLETCREALLAEAKDRNFLILDDTSKILPSKLAEALIAKITGE